MAETVWDVYFYFGSESSMASRSFAKSSEFMEFSSCVGPSLSSRSIPKIEGCASVPLKVVGAEEVSVEGGADASASTASSCSALPCWLRRAASSASCLLSCKANWSSMSSSSSS
eukprot:XP_001705694.1 Hypothetical protein GL50803_20875 [Giardia lamblia ATCC 50803]